MCHIGLFIDPTDAARSHDFFIQMPKSSGIKGGDAPMNFPAMVTANATRVGDIGSIAPTVAAKPLEIEKLLELMERFLKKLRYDRDRGEVCMIAEAIRNAPWNKEARLVFMRALFASLTWQ